MAQGGLGGRSCVRLRDCGDEFCPPPQTEILPLWLWPWCRRTCLECLSQSDTWVEMWFPPHLQSHNYRVFFHTKCSEHIRPRKLCRPLSLTKVQEDLAVVPRHVQLVFTEEIIVLLLFDLCHNVLGFLSRGSMQRRWLCDSLFSLSDLQRQQRRASKV